MFRYAIICLSCLLAAAMPISGAQGPVQPQPTPAAAKPGSSPAPAVISPEVADNQAVITIQGLCPAAAGTSAPPAAKTAAKAAQKTATNVAATHSCVTTVTKAQLEKLIGALNTTNQPVTPQVRRQFAQNYVELLTYAEAAKKAGTEDANFAEMMRFIRLRTLVSVYRTHLQEQYAKPPDKEIQGFYGQNTPKYEEVKLSRIFIPAKNPSAQDKDAWEKKASQLANEIRDRAAKGEDMEKLQKEAYTTLGLTISPPTTNMGERRHGMLPQAQEQELFALKPGEVSKLEQEAAGYSIYKVDAKDTLPLDKVKDEISRELARASMDAKTREINTAVHAELNESYFGPAAPPPSTIPPESIRPAGVPGPARPTAPSQQPQAGAPPAASPQPAASPAAPKP